MKGIIQTGYGDPREVLRIGEVVPPDVDDDGVLVLVRAASIHIGAVYGVRGFPKVMRPMFKSFVAESGVIGQNMAGIVEAVGTNVTQLAVGDEVFGSCKGAFAEYATATSARATTREHPSSPCDRPQWVGRRHGFSRRPRPDGGWCRRSGWRLRG